MFSANQDMNGARKYVQAILKEGMPPIMADICRLLETLLQTPKLLACSAGT
jgi:hypothetical protein